MGKASVICLEFANWNGSINIYTPGRNITVLRWSYGMIYSPLQGNIYIYISCISGTVYTATITNSWPGREVCHLFETTPARPLEEEGLDVAGSSEKGSRKWWKLTCAKRRWPCLKQDQQKCTVISTYMGKLQLTNLQKKSGNFGRQDAMYIIPWWNHLYLFVAIIWPCESDKNSCFGGLPQCFLLFFVNASWRYTVIIENNWRITSTKRDWKDKLSMGGNHGALAQKLKLDYRCYK